MCIGCDWPPRISEVVLIKSRSFETSLTEHVLHLLLHGGGQLRRRLTHQVSVLCGGSALRASNSVRSFRVPGHVEVWAAARTLERHRGSRRRHSRSLITKGTAARCGHRAPQGRRTVGDCCDTPIRQVHATYEGRGDGRIRRARTSGVGISIAAADISGKRTWRAGSSQCRSSS